MRNRVSHIGRIGRAVRLTAFAAVAAALAGCVSIFPETGEHQGRYRLTPPSDIDAGGRKLTSGVVLDEPESDRALDTALIAIVRQDNRYEYFADVEWSDRLPALVQTVFLQAFENADVATSVGRRASGVRGDYVIATELRDFHADFRAGRPVARVVIQAKIIDPRRGTVIAARRIEALGPSQSRDIDAMAAAFDSATKDAASELVLWVVEAIPQDTE